MRKRLDPAAAFFPLFSVALAAANCVCDGGGDDGGDAGGVLGDDSHAMATAVCAVQERCDPFLYGRLFADDATCIAGQAARFQHAQAADIARCTAVLPDLDCGLFSSQPSLLARFTANVTLWPDEARAACFAAFHDGPRADGDFCLDSLECASGFCDVATTGECALCATPSGAGESCFDRYEADFFFHDCDEGLACEGVCVAPKRIGETCDDGAPCVAPASCYDDGICRYGRDGDRCEPQNTINHAEVACELGATCVGEGGGVCKNDVAANDGDSCTFDEQCPPESACFDDDDDVTRLVRRCHPRGGPGDRCIEKIDGGFNSTSDRCAGGSVCLGDAGCGPAADTPIDLCEDGGFDCADAAQRCDFETHTCFTPASDGAPCTAGEDCASFLCTNSGVCTSTFDTDTLCESP